jgi:ribonuclease D
VIGIAVETSAFETKNPNRVSLIQLATSDEVFVIDAVALRESLERRSAQWLMDVFNVPSIVKLGQLHYTSPFESLSTLT